MKNVVAIVIVVLISFSLASPPPPPESPPPHSTTASCAEQSNSFVYIVERLNGAYAQPTKSDICGDCSDSVCAVQFADTPPSANQSTRVDAINSAWAQLHRKHPLSSIPFHHYILIISGATLVTSSSPPDPPPFSATLLRQFEAALSTADFSVAIPSLHLLPSPSPHTPNTTSSVLNPFASGILVCKAHAAADIFPLSTTSSLGSSDSVSRSSDVGFALSAASVISHRRFGAKFVSMPSFAVQWLRPPPFGIGPSSLLLSTHSSHSQLCNLYNSFTSDDNMDAVTFQQSHTHTMPPMQIPHAAAFASNNASSPAAAPAPAAAPRSPNCCNVYWQNRSACVSFTSRDSCPPQQAPVLCLLPPSHIAHSWTAASADVNVPPAPKHNTLHLAALPLDAHSFSSIFCHDLVAGNCTCGVDMCGPKATILRYPQLESMTAWAPSDKDHAPWLQMDLGDVETKMMGVVTRARRDELQWVKEFRVTISNSSNSSAEAWTTVGSFLGNMDPKNDKVNMFSAPVFARYIRLHPLQMFSYRSMRADIIIDSQPRTHTAYSMPHLLPPPPLPFIHSLSHKRILMIGDSHTRFHYLHLAHYMCFQQQAGSKFVEDMFWQKGSLEWQTYDEKWDDFYRESTFAFDGHQMCDCHRPAAWRELGYEVRVTRCADVEITFVLMYGAKNVVGRLPLHLGDFDVLARSRSINSVLRCAAGLRGCPKGGCFNIQQVGHVQAEIEEMKSKLMAQVLNGEIDSDDMFNVLESFEKSKTAPPPRVCQGAGGYAWHDAAYGMLGNGGLWEYANLTHFLEAWSNATGGADLFFIGQGNHLDFSDSSHISSILSSCLIAAKNASSSRCIWRAPRQKEVKFSSGNDPITIAIQSSADQVSEKWSIFRPDDLLYHAPPEFFVDSVGHLSGAGNDILNNGFLWFIWSLIGESK